MLLNVFFVRCILLFEIGKCEALYVLVITGLVQNSKLTGEDGMDWRHFEKKKNCFTLFRPFTGAEGFFMSNKEIKTRDRKSVV